MLQNMLSRKFSRIFPSQIVTPQELYHSVDAKTPDLRIINSSFNMGLLKFTNETYLQERIPNSTYFDPDVVADTSVNLPHMLPSLNDFEHFAEELDISNKDRIVVYSDDNISGAARAYWTFKTFGLDAYVMNGGFQLWKKLKYEVETGEPTHQHRKLNTIRYKHQFHPELVKNREEVMRKAYKITHHLEDGEIVDNRSSGRFLSEVQEPRPGVRSGRVPGAKNLFFGELMMDGGRSLKDVNELQEVFNLHRINLHKPVTYYCGSGVTASLALLASDLVNEGGQYSVYDGSWAEWGSLPEPTEDELKNTAK